MEFVIRLILSLALIDFVLTLFWIYRWQSASFLKKFKLRVPLKLIEANPIVRHGIEKFGLYPGATLGYAFVFMIQILLAGIHFVVAWIIVAILLGAVVAHIKNNITTNNGHIIKMTKAYNKEISKREKHEETH